VKHVTATAASRNFAQVLDRAEHAGESVVIERHGRPVAEIRPTEARKTSTVADFLDVLRQFPPDDTWDEDMRNVIAERDGSYTPDRWEAS
jgi:prevent-host-death family protein